ncbi:hypothetical protein AAVH_41970, partial [Aphelenchoides avenae]
MHIWQWIATLLAGLVGVTSALRVWDDWLVDQEPLKTVAKFGIQQVDHLNQENTMGYIFGNVTDAEEAAGGAGGGHKIKAAERVALFIVPETQYLQLLANGPFDGRRSDMCSTILR